MTTRSGAEFDPRADVWSVRDPVSVLRADFLELRVLLGRDLIACLQATLIWTIERNTSSHTSNLFERFQHFGLQQAEQISEAGCITATIFLNYRSSLSPSRQWYVSSLAVLFRYWIDLGHDGLASDLVECLETIVLPGNSQGHHVLSRDREHGPLSEFEFQFCWAILDNAHEAGEINDADHLLLGLEMALGSRPIQFAAMRVCDVQPVVLPDGLIQYFIDVPRAKNGKMPRTEFKRRQLPPALGKALHDYAELTSNRFLKILEDASQVPLFPVAKPDETAQSGWEYHYTNEAIAARIKNRWRTVLEDVQSLRLTARRLRYTLGTRAAQEGYGVFVIAEMLDHTTTTSTRVYVEATPEVTTRINRALASRLGAIARIFRGRLISSEAEATRAGDQSSLIEDYRMDAPSHTMGNCAKNGPCALLAPIACYTCPSFEPWVDGPHESVVVYLLVERDRLLDADEPRLAAVLDLQIAAAAKVADLCKAMKEKRP